MQPPAYGMEPPVVSRGSGSFNNVWSKEGTSGTWQQGSSGEVDDRPVIGVHCCPLVSPLQTLLTNAVFGAGGELDIVVIGGQV